MASKLLLVRHARILPEYLGSWVGKTDIPADPAGLKELGALSRLVLSKSPEKCFCSPLSRATQTAQAVAGPLNIEVADDLKEVDFGLWEGRTFEEVGRTYPQEVKRWMEMPDDFGFPKGDTVKSFMERMERAAQRLAQDQAKTLLVVTHGGVIRGLLCYFLKLKPSHFFSFDIKNAGCTTLELYESMAVLSALNQGLLADA